MRMRSGGYLWRSWRQSLDMHSHACSHACECLWQILKKIKCNIHEEGGKIKETPFHTDTR